MISISKLFKNKKNKNKEKNKIKTNIKLNEIWYNTWVIKFQNFIIIFFIQIQQFTRENALFIYPIIFLNHFILLAIFKFILLFMKNYYILWVLFNWLSDK